LATSTGPIAKKMLAEVRDTEDRGPVASATRSSTTFL